MDKEPSEQGRLFRSTFWVTVALVSLTAGIAVAIASFFKLLPWMLFIGWVAYAIAGGRPKSATAMAGCLLLGIALGMCGAILHATMVPSLGSVALPVMVFIVTAVAVSSQLLATLNYVGGYFLGMIGYFASGLEPDLPAFLTLSSAAVLGLLAGYVATVAPALICRLPMGQRLRNRALRKF